MAEDVPVGELEDNVGGGGGGIIESPDVEGKGGERGGLVVRLEAFREGIEVEAVSKRLQLRLDASDVDLLQTSAQHGSAVGPFFCAVRVNMTDAGPTSQPQTDGAPVPCTQAYSGPEGDTLELVRFLAVVPKSSVYDPEHRRMVQIQINETKERVQEENKRAEIDRVRERKDKYNAKAFQ